MFAGIDIDEEDAARFEKAGISAQIPRENFDVEASLLDGQSAYDIAHFLTKERGLDYDALKLAGLGDDDIVHRLTPSRRGEFWDYAREGIAKGLPPGAAFLPGAFYGGKAGFVLGGPPGAVLGGLAGGLTAALGAEFAQQPVWEHFLGEDVVPGGRHVVQGGITVGTALPSLRLPWSMKNWATKGGDLGSQQFLNNLATYSGRTDTYAKVIKALGAAAGTQKSQTLTAFTENLLKRMVAERTTPGAIQSRLPYIGDVPLNAFWLATDLSAIATMGGAASVVEEHDPGAIGTRFLAETAAGFINPGSIVASQIPNIKNLVTRLVSPATKVGAHNAAAKKLNAVFHEYGDLRTPEEVEDFIRRLAEDDEIAGLLRGIEDEEFRVDVPVIDPRTNQVKRVQVDADGEYAVTPDGEYIDDPSGEPLIVPADPRTPAMKVGSFFPALINIEKSMAKSDLALGERINERAQQSLKGLRHLLSLMISTGDRELVTHAMMIRDKAFGDILSGRLNQAVQEAVHTSQKAIDRGSTTVANTGTRIHETLNRVFKEARDQESILYDAALHTDEVIIPEQTVAAYQKLIKEGYGSMTEMPTGIAVPISAMTDEALPDLATLAATAQDRVTNARSAVDLEVAQASGRTEERFKGFFADASDEAGNLDRANLREALKDYVGRKGDVAWETPFSFNPTKKLVEKQLQLMHHEDELAALNQTIRMGEDAPDEIPLQEMSLNQLVKFRSGMLSKARIAGADPTKRREAAVYSRMANAALGDIGLKVNSVPKNPETRAALIAEIGLARVENLESLQTAYAFSRRFNDVFTRSLVGNIFDYEKTGQSALIPEATAEWLFKGNVNEVTLRLKDVDSALAFLTNQSDALGLPAGETAARQFSAIGRTMSVRLAEEQFLRSLAQKFINAETGELKTGQLATYLRDFDHVLDAYPTLKRDLNNAQTAQTLLSTTRRDMGLTPGVKTMEEGVAARRKVAKDPPWRGSQAEQRYFNQLAWTKLVGAENPSLALKGIVGAPDRRSANAAERVDDVIKHAKKMAEGKDFVDPVTGVTVTSKDLMDGLKTSLLDSAWLYAGGSDNKFNPTAFHDYLFKPLGSGKPSLLTKMRQNGLVSDGEAVRINTLVTAMQNVEKAQAGFGTLPEAVVKGLKGTMANDLLQSLILKLSGSAIGSQAGRVTQSLLGRGPIGLIERSAGSTYIQNIFDKIPALQAREIMLDAFENPQILSLLTETIDDPKEAFRLINRFNAYLFASGIVATQLEEAPPRFWRYSQDPEKREKALKFYGIPLSQERPAPPVSALPIGATVEPVQPPSVEPEIPAQLVSQAPRSPAIQPKPIAQTPSPGQRSRFAAMFPGDITSGLIRQQDVARGIGSLG